jgi:hypothetical protein
VTERRNGVMSTVNRESRGLAPGIAEPDPRRWLALAVLAAMQFMLVMEVTVVTVAGRVPPR